MGVVLAAIPYTTFPKITLGPFDLRTFGLAVAVGVLIGAWLAARWSERFGIDRDQTYRLATRMVVAGVIGARITWVLSHLDQIDSPVDVIAIWEGGLQFSGGFAAAVLLGYPAYRTIPLRERWHALDGYAYGLTIGLAFGRVGCIAVGEHFGRASDFFLAVRYDGGSVRESTLGSDPLAEGMTFHHTAVYELLYLLALFGLLAVLRRRAVARPGTLIGTFCVVYGIARFASDSLRVNDERVLMMTGAQYLMIVTVAAGIWILLRVRRLLDAAGPSGAGAGGSSAAVHVPDEVEAPDS
jgi:phosphatidylglycerol:prolipoprotein diacylglycerol transferase